MQGSLPSRHKSSVESPPCWLPPLPHCTSACATGAQPSPGQAFLSSPSLPGLWTQEPGLEPQRMSLFLLRQPPFHTPPGETIPLPGSFSNYRASSQPLPGRGTAQLSSPSQRSCQPSSRTRFSFSFSFQSTASFRPRYTSSLKPSS